MYLKRIEVVGFKSFADKLNIDFEPGITTVVGPNGSGKSNIVDAVRWVLGEQSVKQLRGATQMVDVIFSGSQTRKPQSYASVSLILDNTDHYLPIDYSEVAITRRVYRDGDSEYLINKDKVRLKDITDLILDTGLGRDSFSIISQGKVQEILSSKSVDRRVIFEEAAGVLKYRKRKESAFKKLGRTEENLHRVTDILGELERTLKPLKRQADKAMIFREKRDELHEIEVSVLAHDIKNLDQETKASEAVGMTFQEEMTGIETVILKEEAFVEEKKSLLGKLDEIIASIQDRYVEASSSVVKLEGQKQVMAERRKYAKDHESEFKDNALRLREESMQLASTLDSINYELSTKRKEYADKQIMKKTIEDALMKEKQTQKDLEEDIQRSIRLIEELRTRTESLTNSISSHENVNFAVKSVLEEKSLNGIHDVIGNLITVEKEYTVAIEIALGMASQFIVTSTRDDAKEAVAYLKKNRFGRATFFPMDVIESRKIYGEAYEICQMDEGFVGFASDLVSFDESYRSIVENQLGNIIVVDNLDVANELSIKINKKFKIVTLSGEVVHIGGSITGGQNKRGNKGLIAQRQELEEGLDKLTTVENNLEQLKDDSIQVKESIEGLEASRYDLAVLQVNLEELIASKLTSQKELEEKKRKVDEEQTHLTEILDNQSEEDEEVGLLNQLFEAQKKRDQLEREIKEARSKRFAYTEEIDLHEQTIRANQKQLNLVTKELQKIEVSINRHEIEMNNLLERLSESYALTYEAALLTARFDLDFDLSRVRVKSLREEIVRLGFINEEAIEQYEENQTRFDTLTEQKTDLDEAKEKLISTIKELDEVMKDKFDTTFRQVQDQFSNVFRHLFGGGNAELVLTDPENLLDSGVDIIAQPPGKKLQHLSLMSGGEKALTAISLLFAILRIRTVPFVILDEVEAALDEANVSRYADYLHKYSNKTQFIVITHRKGTMEKSDVLYGVTMQNDGVSNLVSVRLEDVHHYIDKHEEAK